MFVSLLRVKLSIMSPESFISLLKFHMFQMQIYVVIDISTKNWEDFVTFDCLVSNYIDGNSFFLIKESIFLFKTTKSWK